MNKILMMSDRLNFSTVESFNERFGSEQACIDYMYKIKWPHGFRCPVCEHPQAYVIRTRRLPLYQCRSCKHQTSLTAGTVMEGSQTPLRKWLLAAALISRIEQGINAVQLQGILEVTYKTAYTILKKLRIVMSQADAEKPLTDQVKIVNHHYGRPYNSMGERHPQEHPFYLGLSLDNQNRLRYVKMKLVAPVHRKEDYISTRSNKIFVHQHISKKFQKQAVFFPRYQFHRLPHTARLWNAARQWINTTFHGLGSKYLQLYFDEFYYRVNLSIAGIPIFNNLVSLCVHSPVTKGYPQPNYDDLALAAWPVAYKPYALYTPTTLYAL